VQGSTYDFERVLDIVRCTFHRSLQGRLAGLLLFVAQLLLKRGQKRVPREWPFAAAGGDRRPNSWRRGTGVAERVVGVKVEVEGQARLGVCL